jgi:hypothetical protein
MASPNDPVFWLHYANIDRLWTWILLSVGIYLVSEHQKDAIFFCFFIMHLSMIIWPCLWLYEHSLGLVVQKVVLGNVEVFILREQ